LKEQNTSTLLAVCYRIWSFWSYTCNLQIATARNCL